MPADSRGFVVWDISVAEKNTPDKDYKDVVSQVKDVYCFDFHVTI